MKKIGLIISSLIVAMSFFIFPAIALAQAAPAAAQTQTTSSSPKDAICEGVGFVNGGSGCNQPQGQPDVQGTVEKVITILSLIVAVIAIIMIMIGGLKYITSGGDSAKVSSAKDTILYSVIGLAVALLAQVIVRFVVNRLT